MVSRALTLAAAASLAVAATLVPVASPARAAASAPSLVILEQSDWYELSDSGRSLEWRRREVIVCRRDTRRVERFQGHGVVEQFGFKTRDARVTRVSNDGKRRVWTLKDYTKAPLLMQGGFISDAQLFMLPIEVFGAGDTLIRESSQVLEPFLGFAVQHFGDPDVPILRATLDVRIPEELAPHYALHNGAPEPARSRDGSTVAWRWELGPLEPLAEDDWTPAGEDRYPAVSLGVSRMGWGPCATWREVAASYWNEVTRRSRPDDDPPLAARPGADTRATLLAALNRVQDEVRYVAISLGPGGLIPHAPPETFRRRFGDCKDMALLLRSALRGIGVEAALALVDTRPPAGLSLDPLPTLRCFNHAVVYVPADSGGYWLDPTAQFGSVDTPRPDIQGSPALVLTGRDAGYRRIQLNPAPSNRVTSHARLEPRPTGPWSLMVDVCLEGIPAVYLKGQLARDRELVVGRTIPITGNWWPLTGPAAPSDSITITAIESDRVRLSGRLNSSLETARLNGRANLMLPWRAPPGSLADLPTLPRPAPVEFDWPRVYSDTLVIVGGVALCGTPDSLRWSKDNAGIAGGMEVRADGPDLVLTRDVRILELRHDTAAQAALKEMLQILRRRGSIPLRPAR